MQSQDGGVILVAFLAVFLVCCPAGEAESFMLPSAGGTFNVQVKSFKELRYTDVIQQQYDFSCGSAALATLLSFHYDHPTSEEEVFTAMYEAGDKDLIRTQGFSLLDLKNYLESKDYRTDGYQLSLDKLRRLSVPAIALINTAGYLHLVVIKAVSDHEVLIGDPALGVRKLNRNDFEAKWNGILLLIRNNAELGRLHFNTPEIWQSQAGSPYESAISRTGLTHYMLTLPHPGDYH